MVSMSVSVPEELKQKLDEFDEVNWSAVARKAFEERVSQLELLDKLTEKSTATEKDVLVLGRKIRRGIAKRHNELT
ncbi:MAG: hypothetical protein V1777_03085 [Candidatus Micrarchaeota archaeon]